MYFSIVHFVVFFGSCAAGNITLISVTFKQDLEEDFRTMDPTYDVIIKGLRKKDPEVFQNFTHITLRCVGEPTDLAADISPVEQLNFGEDFRRIQWSTVHQEVIIAEDEVASCFFRFFYRNQHLFVANLSRQFTVITTTSKLAP